MPNNYDHKSWWHTLPGILTAIATLITAIAGLIAILQTHRPSSPGLELAATSAVESKPVTATKEVAKEEDIKNFIFKGNVGKLPAVFDLTFNFTQQKIHGSYHYPARQGIAYTITGTIQKDHI